LHLRHENFIETPSWNLNLEVVLTSSEFGLCT